MQLIIHGASDDLVEVEGAIREEFPYEEGGMLVAVSDGTLLTIQYDDMGFWRVSRVAAGTSTYTHDSVDGRDEAEGPRTLCGVEVPGYSDAATLDRRSGPSTAAPFKWIVVAPISAGKRP